MLSGDSVPRVRQEATLQEALAELNAKSLGAVFVTGRQGELVGIVTDGDLRRALSGGQAFDSLTLDQVMTVRPQTVYSDLLAADALSLKFRKYGKI